MLAVDFFASSRGGQGSWIFVLFLGGFFFWGSLVVRCLIVLLGDVERFGFEFMQRVTNVVFYWVGGTLETAFYMNLVFAQLYFIYGLSYGPEFQKWIAKSAFSNYHSEEYKEKCSPSKLIFSLQNINSEIQVANLLDKSMCCCGIIFNHSFNYLGY